MTAITLLNKLIDSGIKLYKEGDQLKVKAHKGVVTKELLEEISLSKTELLDMLDAGFAGDTAIEKALPQMQYPVTYQQKAMWMISQDRNASAAYNMPMLVAVKGGFDVAALHLRMWSRRMSGYIEADPIKPSAPALLTALANSQPLHQIIPAWLIG